MSFTMILTGFFVVFLVSFSQAANEDSSSFRKEVPFVVAPPPQPSSEQVSNLLPENFDKSDDQPFTFQQESPNSRGRSDIEIEEELQQPQQPSSGGYFYPKPSKAFNLPAFKTLAADSSLIQPADFALDVQEGEQEAERLTRSPQRQTFYPPIMGQTFYPSIMGQTFYPPPQGQTFYPMPSRRPSMPNRGGRNPGIRPLPAIYYSRPLLG